MKIIKQMDTDMDRDVKNFSKAMSGAEIRAAIESMEPETEISFAGCKASTVRAYAANASLIPGHGYRTRTDRQKGVIIVTRVV